MKKKKTVLEKVINLKNEYPIGKNSNTSKCYSCNKFLKNCRDFIHYKLIVGLIKLHRLKVAKYVKSLLLDKTSARKLKISMRTIIQMIPREGIIVIFTKDIKLSDILNSRP